MNVDDDDDDDDDVGGVDVDAVVDAAAAVTTTVAGVSSSLDSAASIEYDSFRNIRFNQLLLSLRLTGCSSKLSSPDPAAAAAAAVAAAAVAAAAEAAAATTFELEAAFEGELSEEPFLLLSPTLSYTAPSEASS